MPTPSRELDALREGLRSPDAEGAVAAWEGLVLATLDRTPDPAQVHRWAEVYRDVSRQLTEDANDTDDAPPSSELTSSRARPADLDAVWGLVYSARTFLLARRILEQTPAPAGLIMDLGAGWGPFALAAALRHPLAEVTLVDVAQARLHHAAKLFEHAGLRRPKIVVTDARALAPSPTASVVSFPYSLGEMTAGRPDEASAGASLLDAWTHKLSPDGRLYVLEPGTRTSARRLQTIRDRLAARSPSPILAPCVARECPRQPDPRNWCHFTWRLALGPTGQAIANAARRRWQEVHASWLVLGASDGAAAGAMAARVLELRAADKTKATVQACTAEGEVPLTALRRHRAAYDLLCDLPAGTLLGLDPAHLDRRGDGLRLTHPELLQVQSPF